MGPYKPILNQYPFTHDKKQQQRFQHSWFQKFPWLEYSIKEDRVFCFPCYLFATCPSKYPTFTIRGFQNWKRFNCGDDCPLKEHVGDHNSQHNHHMRCWVNLKDPLCHIDNVMSRQSSEVVLHNRLRLKTSLETVKWLAMQGCTFRGHDESINSTNRGNFIEMIKL
ncbi:hypothetical protein Ddye_027025 [Dipteronia dyeriana]|uniref:TTF-type domain-containing protein n=1 Tax=Dipteronia dyeriana TaxID=168575 RepID=A0AAD9TNC6_9ROSI|nr:hypothetical protein Ddye_027025 [Dipteronia dyeriana]